MDADTAGKLSLLVNGGTQICKLGFGFGGRFVLLLVLILGMGGSVIYWIYAEPHTPKTFLDALVSGYLMSSSAIGTYHLLMESKKGTPEEPAAVTIQQPEGASLPVHNAPVQEVPDAPAPSAPSPPVTSSAPRSPIDI